MNEQTIRQGLDQYDEALGAGMTYAEAKEFAYSSVPGLRESLSDISNAGMWGNEIKRINKAHRAESPQRTAAKIVTPPAINGNNTREETFVRTSTGRINITETLLAWLECNRPAVGTEIALGNVALWGRLLGVTPTGITMPFRHYDNRDNGLARAGWQFEIVDSAYRCFVVRVVAAPPPPAPPEPVAPPAERTYTNAEVQALFAEFLATRQ